MINALSTKGRKLVTIIDPHIKRDSGYWVHTDSTSKGLYVKNRERTDYEGIPTLPFSLHNEKQLRFIVDMQVTQHVVTFSLGWCWPGSSSYLDFLNPETASYYSNCYSPEIFKGSNNDVYIWNDMNEPSVFSGPEGTMPKDAIHHGEWEHRDIHNMYGFFQVIFLHFFQLLYRHIQTA